LKYFNSQALDWGLSRGLIKNRPLTGFFYSIFSSGRQISDPPCPEKPATRSWLVELAGDDGVLDEEFKRNDFEGVLVSGFENNRAGGSGLLDLQPAGSTDAPAVTWFETGETKLGHRGTEVVSEGFGGFEKGRVDDAADGVDSIVFGASLATAGSVEAGHGLAAADVERLAEDVFAAVFDGFDVGHR